MAFEEPGISHLCRCALTFPLEHRSISVVPAPVANEVDSTPTRRKPFAESPVLGPRGRRTHQRVLDAALEAFAESGYDRTTLDRVAELAGCSRVTIYQYASGKDELFRRLASQAAAQMWAAFEALEDVTPDGRGRDSLLTCISRLADIEARYEPIIRAFEAAAESDRSLAGSATSITERAVGVFEARLVEADLPRRLLDPTVELLNTGVISALSRLSILRAAAPEHYPRDRADAAIADVVHRAVFGPLPGVNLHPRSTVADAPTLRLSPEGRTIFDRARDLETEAAGPGKRALRSILGVANDLIAHRGYRGLRIDDIVRAAGVSRGSFYTYFDDIEDFVRVMGVRAIQDVSEVVRQLPAAPTRAAMRAWLGRFAEVNLTSGPLVRVWIEAIEGPLRGDRAAVTDWGRRRMAAVLQARELGDVDIEAEILMAIVEVFGSRTRTKAELDACLLLIERAFVSPETSTTDRPSGR
jgi:AcrR family transcriptional regulator